MPTVQTNLLEIAYRDVGPRNAPVVLLLHGWPDDASTWDGVAPALNAAGLRTIAAMYRGFSGTRFLSPDTPRTGNTAVLALDAIEMLDRLGVKEFSVAGGRRRASADQAADHSFGKSGAPKIRAAQINRLPQSSRSSAIESPAPSWAQPPRIPERNLANALRNTTFPGTSSARPATP